MIKLGKDLTREEIDLINLWRQREFKSKELVAPSPDNQDRANLFIFIKDESKKVIAFGKLNSLDLNFSNQIFKVLCFSTVISTEKGKGSGRQVMDEIKDYVFQTGMTAIGFCETELLPFYLKCGYEILSPEDNQFVYIDNNAEVIPGIVPGEVIFTRGSDGVMDKILSSEDKTVKIQRNQI